MPAGKFRDAAASGDRAGRVGAADGDRPDFTGDDTAEVFGELFGRHARDLYRYLAARVGASLADDLVADTFVTALRRRETYDPTRGTARSWLFGIAANELRHHQRSEIRHHAATVRLAGQFASISGPEDRTLDKVAAAEAVGRLAGALRGLSEDDRDLLLLKSWTELEPSEIAASLGLPAGTVRSRLHRIRSTLRAAAARSEPADHSVIPFPSADRKRTDDV